MKLFTVGPVTSYPEVMAVYQKGFPYFRTEEYGKVVKDNLKGLADLLGTGYYDNIIYLTASGTAAMEAVVENCFSTSDKVLIINGGSFGHRFCNLCEWHKVSFDSINLKWDEQLTEQHLQPFDNSGYTSLLVNLHETSTGQLYDVEMLSKFCQRNNMYFIVDAISTFLADDYNMEKYNIDATIFSSQKGLSLSPGLSFVALSSRMKEKVMLEGEPKTCYFNFKDYFLNITRGQTPYTPAVYIMYELKEMLSLIGAKGKEAWLKQIENNCLYFRDKISKLGLKIPKTYRLSNMLTPVMFNDINAYDVFLSLQNRYRIFVNPCSGDLKDKLLRVSHVGNISVSDIDFLVKKMMEIINELRGYK
jgi:aspartate aminotransferase-like enzyme